MRGRVIAGMLGLLLAVTGAVGPASAVSAPTSAPAPAPAPTPTPAATLTMTTLNWGEPVSLLDARYPAWAHPAGSAAGTQVVVTVGLKHLTVHGWKMTLTAPDSFQGPEVLSCGDDEPPASGHLRCTFTVDATSGINKLGVSVTADGRTIASAHGGVLRAGTLGWDAGYEVLDATGAWVAVPHDQAVTLLATSSTALRYVVLNTGTLPLRVEGGCSEAPLVEGAQIKCRVRGVRPAQSLVGEYTRHLRLQDPAGAGASFDIRTGIRTFAGSFQLARTELAPDGIAVVTASGLPRDSAFALQYRLDSLSSILGSSVTRDGSTRAAFPLPQLANGPAHLNVVHDGLTIASLPFTVTGSSTDAAAPTWPWLLIPLGLLVVLVLMLALRRRRRRVRRAIPEASRAPHPPDPYPDANPATPAPAASRRP